METFGKSLRQQREFRSIPLEEIAEVTKIRLQFLQAIESGDVESLPHPTFVKGFLRAYAKHVGLDEDEIVLGYEQVLLARQEEEAPDPSVERSSSFKDVVEKNPFPAKIGGGILILVLIGLVVWFGKDPSEPKTQKQAPTTPVAVTPIPKPVEEPKKEPEEPLAAESISKPTEKPLEQAASTQVQDREAPEEEQAVQVESKPVIPATAALPETEPAVSPASPQVSLRVHAQEDTWLLVEIDGQKILDFILRTGESKTLQAEEKILFKTIGNSAAISFSMGGQTLPLGGKSGQVLHDITIKAQTDLKQLVEKLGAKKSFQVTNQNRPGQ